MLLDGWWEARARVRVRERGRESSSDGRTETSECLGIDSCC